MWCDCKWHKTQVKVVVQKDVLSHAIRSLGVEYPRFGSLTWHAGYVLGLPLQSHKKALGVLSTTWDKKHPAKEEWLSSCTSLLFLQKPTEAFFSGCIGQCQMILEKPWIIEQYNERALGFHRKLLYCRSGIVLKVKELMKRSDCVKFNHL